MTANDDTPRRRASLELLRAEASDELVVLTLRADNIFENGGVRPNRSRNYRVLRQIALDYPPLTKAVWRILGEEEPHRRWDANVRLDAS